MTAVLALRAVAISTVARDAAAKPAAAARSEDAIL